MGNWFDGLSVLEKVFAACAAAGGEIDHTEMGFRILTFQELTAFFMMFGLVGLALSRGSTEPLWSMVGGAGAGGATVWFTDKLFRLFASLQHSGTLNLHNAVNEQGTIYLTVPAEGTGKIRVAMQGRIGGGGAISPLYSRRRRLSSALSAGLSLFFTHAHDHQHSPRRSAVAAEYSH